MLIDTDARARLHLSGAGGDRCPGGVSNPPGSNPDDMSTFTFLYAHSQAKRNNTPKKLACRASKEMNIKAGIEDEKTYMREPDRYLYKAEPP